jgi:hypothetical protein
MDPLVFLPTRCNLHCLPSRKSPRLYLTGPDYLSRWRQSALFPAYKDTAKLYRFLLRLKATLGLGNRVLHSIRSWSIHEFVEDCFPQLNSQAVLIGTPGPAQKIVVQFWRESEIVGYLKYGETPAARIQIAQEAAILKALPSGIGPTLLKLGALKNGLAIILTPVHGRPLNAQLPLNDKIQLLLNTLRISSPVKFWDHPWIKKIKDNVPSQDWLIPLAGRDWPVVIHHGDFAPWNVLSRPDGSLGVIDWEYGTVEGFPLLDLAFFVLQVGRLIYGWTPIKAKDYSIGVLSGQRVWPIRRDEASSLVCLCAYDTYNQALPAKDKVYYKSQAWWRAVWESEL